MNHAELGVLIFDAVVSRAQINLQRGIPGVIKLNIRDEELFTLFKSERIAHRPMTDLAEQLTQDGLQAEWDTSACVLRVSYDPLGLRTDFPTLRDLIQANVKDVT